MRDDAGPGTHRASAGPTPADAHLDQAPPALVVRDVSVSYQRGQSRHARGRIGARFGAVAPRLAVDHVSLELARRGSLALLGPSGCGKSSLLRAIVGLERPTSGHVYYDGVDLTRTPPHRRGFGLLFQDGQLFPHRDVARNIAYGLEAQGLPRAERDARVSDMLDLVGLAGYGGRAVSELSGGERQRVALARALAPRPRLMLLDEPFSALDAGLRVRLAAEVRDILREAGTPSITVTHDQREAFAMADRVGVMAGGRLLQVGTRDELARSPVPEVRAFMRPQRD